MAEFSLCIIYVFSFLQVAVHDLKEFLAPASVPHLIAGCMMHALKHNQVERKCIGILLKGMLKQNLIKISDFRDGFFTLLLNVEYTSSSINTCDLAQLTAPIFETDIVDIGFLGSLCDILDSKLAVGFVAYTLKEILNSTVRFYMNIGLFNFFLKSFHPTSVGGSR